MAGTDPLTEEQRSYELPDGSIIQVDHKTRYAATEILFNPEIGKLTGLSIPRMIVDSIEKCPKFLHRVLQQNKMYRICIGILCLQVDQQC